MGNLVIYESSTRKKHQEAIGGHLAGAQERAGWQADSEEQFKSMGKQLWRLGRAAASAGMAALSLRVTVNSLMSGVHVECKDMGELLDAENAIRRPPSLFVDSRTSSPGRCANRS